MNYVGFTLVVGRLKLQNRLMLLNSNSARHWYVSLDIHGGILWGGRVLSTRAR